MNVESESEREQTRPLDLVLQFLGLERKQGDEYTARCPAHVDQVASLSVALGRDDQVLLHCRAGCTTEAVVQQMGLRMADLFAVQSETASASKREVADLGRQRNGEGSQADRVVEMVFEEGVELFHDQLGAAWARIPVQEHQETWPCAGKNFRDWCTSRFWSRERKVVGSEALNSGIQILQAHAKFEGEEHELHTRVARHDGAIWYDLCDPGWRAVRIGPDGWAIVDTPPVLFRRFRHQRQQVLPQPGGDLNALVTLSNLQGRSSQCLLQVLLVSCLVPDIPHPILVVHGPQGAAKTTLCRMIRRLVDPSATETLSLPHDVGGLVQQLSHHAMPFYDNATTLPAGISDALCRAVTGEGASKRELYTDDEDVIYTYRRCIGLNGINVVAQRADLLDRSLLIGLDPIPPDRRRPETQVLDDFEKARPLLFGAMLDALSRAQVLHPAVSLPLLPRMADFAGWGSAIAAALGYQEGEFIGAYEDNERSRNEEVLVGDPVAAAVIAFMEDRASWSGTATELLAALEQEAVERRVNPRIKPWPQSPTVLSRKLNEIVHNLAQGGISLNARRDKARRYLLLQRIAGDSVTTVTTVTETSAEGSPGDGFDDDTATQDFASLREFSGNAQIQGNGDAGDADDANHQPPAPDGEAEFF